MAVFIVLLAFGGLCVFGKSEEVSCREGFFRKVQLKSYGLSKEGVVASHIVSSWLDCSLSCLEQQKLCMSFSFLHQFTESREPNCHLFSEVLEDSTDSVEEEDLVFELKKDLDAWETFNFIQIESKICLEQRACQNGGVCLVDSCEPEGYRCACDGLHYGKRCELEINDFDLNFPPSEQNQSYIFVKDAIKSDLTQFTFTTWFKIDVGLSQYHLFTYIVGQNVYIQLYFLTASVTVHQFCGRITDFKRRSFVQPLNDNVWHHFAYLWTSGGEWNLFIDGKLCAIVEEPPRGQIVIPKGGMVYIGNVSNLNAAGESAEYVGELSRLHFWDRALSGDEVERMSIRPTNDVGNVISWFKLADYTFGNVEVIKPSTAANIEKQVNYRLTFYRHNNGYISSPGPVRQLYSLSVCLWLVTKMKVVYISYGSKYENKHHFAFGVNSDDFMFAFINGSEINSTLGNPYISNGRWHFLCVTWQGKSGELRFFYDGILLGEKIIQDNLKAILPKSGNFSVGAEWVNGSTTQLVREIYYGKITHLNVWSDAVSPFAIRTMSAGGLIVNGDVLAWKNVRERILGRLPVKRSIMICFPGYAVLKKRSEWCNENLNSSCGPLYARLGESPLGDGMSWRCYCASALIGSKITYDFKTRSSGCFSKHVELTKIVYNPS